MRFVALEKRHRLADGYRRLFNLEGRNLLLFQHDGQIHIIDNACPHAGAPLDRASICDNQLRCPWHGICFDLDSGKAVAQSMQLVKFQPAFLGADIGIWLQ